MHSLVLTFPGFDPVALRLGPLAIHWYGIMYAIAFGIGYLVLLRRIRQRPFVENAEHPWTSDTVADLMMYIMVGVLAGGRLGYVLFYKALYYLQNPLDIVKVWDGGMSFHGGALGVALGLWLFARRHHHAFFEATDLLVPVVPIGLGLGRLGNFINGELWGRPADPTLPWAMIFPAVDNVPRHPSQLYEIALEGVLLLVLLWWYARRVPAQGKVSAAFLIGYGAFRFVAESFREPDDFLGLLSLGLSMGQWLCLPMILAGAVLWWWAHARAARSRSLSTAEPRSTAATGD